MACINNHRCESCPHPCKAETQEVEFGKLYSSLTVDEKEELLGTPYPACTNVWNAMKRDERVVLIRKSGLYRRKGNKFTALGHDF